MLSLSGYNGIAISPLLKGFLMSKSANHLPFLNAQKQCLIKISFNLKLYIIKSSSEIREKKCSSPVGNKRCKTWISVTEKQL